MTGTTCSSIEKTAKYLLVLAGTCIVLRQLKVSVENVRAGDIIKVSYTEPASNVDAPGFTICLHGPGFTLENTTIKDMSEEAEEVWRKVYFFQLGNFL